jgi:hypothetical protein
MQELTASSQFDSSNAEHMNCLNSMILALAECSDNGETLSKDNYNTKILKKIINSNNYLPSTIQTLPLAKCDELLLSDPKTWPEELQTLFSEDNVVVTKQGCSYPVKTLIDGLRKTVVNQSLGSSSSAQEQQAASTKLPNQTNDSSPSSSPSSSSRWSFLTTYRKAVWQHSGAFAIALVPPIVTYLVQKSGVDLPSPTTMMLLPAGIFAGKTLIEQCIDESAIAGLSLIDTTSIVFDQSNEGKTASFADNIVATAIYQASALCAAGAAVTAVAACNRHNSWQATAACAIASAGLTFSSCTISEFKRAFNQKYANENSSLSRKMDEIRLEQAKTYAVYKNLTSEENRTLRLDGSTKTGLNVNLEHQTDVDKEYQPKLMNYYYLQYKPILQAHDERCIHKNFKQAYVNESLSVARQLLPWNKISSEN